MAVKPRAKLNFDLGTNNNQTTITPISTVTKGDTRKTVATRLPPELYKKAKARAALEGISIQAVIETALSEFIERGNIKQVR